MGGLTQCLSPSWSVKTVVVTGALTTTPSLAVSRPAGSPPVGLVGRFLNIAPILLHGGRSIQSPPPKERNDWWAGCVEAEMAGLRLAQSRAATPSADLNQDWWADLVQAEFVGHSRPVLELRAPSRCLTPAMEREGAAMRHSPDPRSASGTLQPTPPCDANDQFEVKGGTLTASDDGAPSDGAARVIQEQIEAKLCLPLRTPILRGGPRLRRSRTPISSTSLRRSGRLARKPRAANATRQAQLVLLKKLGISIEENAVDANIENKFKAAFRGNISENKKRAMQILLNGELDLSAMNLDLADLDDAEA